MAMLEQIKKKQQTIARCEKSLVLEKLKKRKADTRRKIEFGGLVIKSAFDAYNKAIILGALNYSLELIKREPTYLKIFESIGDNLFLENKSTS